MVDHASGMGVNIGFWNRIFYWAFRKIFKVLCGLQWGVYIDNFDHVFIGKHVRIGEGAKIITRNHNIWNPDIYDEYEAVYIGDYCWIGANAIILPGVSLGPHTVVAAGAVVTKTFADGWCIIAGNPAQVIRRK